MERDDTRAKETPGKHWDREQWSPDTEGPPPGEQEKVWNRHQWSPDNTGTDAERLTGTDPAVDHAGDVDDPAVGGLSGSGQPSGESHWERSDGTE